MANNQNGEDFVVDRHKTDLLSCNGELRPNGVCKHVCVSLCVCLHETMRLSTHLTH